MKRLALAAVLVMLAFVGIAQAASVAAYADGKYMQFYLPAVSHLISASATAPSGPTWAGYYYNGYKGDSIRCPRLATAALSCTLDIPVFMPFINASASTVTAQFKIWDKTSTALQGLGFANDSLATWIPGFASRFIFTTVAADTPCFFHVIGLNYGYKPR